MRRAGGVAALAFLACFAVGASTHPRGKRPVPRVPSVPPQASPEISPSPSVSPSPIASPVAPAVPPPPITIKDSGTVDSLTSLRNPWRSFRDHTPVLVSIRAERIEVPAETSFPIECGNYMQGLLKDVPGVAAPAMGTDCATCWQAWEPWSENDRKAITDCGSFPCDVKLDAFEAGVLRKLESAQRFAAFQGLVQKRAEAYVATGSRLRYEYEGSRADPWEVFANEGLVAKVERPAKPSLRARVLEFRNLGSRVIRQVVDRREAQSAYEAAVWLRDVYTTHYFDSWGEYGNVRCYPDKREIHVVLAVADEFDLFKNTDFLSKIAFPKMRTTGEQEGVAVLDRWFARIAPPPAKK